MTEKFFIKYTLKRKIAFMILILIIPLFIIMVTALLLLGSRLYNTLEIHEDKAVNSVINSFNLLKDETFSFAEIVAKNQVIQRGAYYNETGRILKFFPDIIE